jgi:hypothetical protein
MAPTDEKNVQIKLTPKNFLLIIFNVVYIEVNERRKTCLKAKLKGTSTCIVKPALKGTSIVKPALKGTPIVKPALKAHL